MIIQAFIAIIIAMINTVFGFMPKDFLLPPQIVTTLYTVVYTWNSFMVTFPYAQTAWHMLIYAVVPIELALLILKFFLGSHTPVDDI